MTIPTESSCPKCGAAVTEDAPQQLCPKCVLAEAATRPEPTGSPAGITPPPQLEELIPHFPELEILELIGAGGMGAVYKARQPKLDRLVALKILSHDLSTDPAFEERFTREAHVLARLNHPHIVTVFDSGTAGPFCFLLMEYVDGVNLRQAMRTGGFTPADSLALVQDICAALKFAHEEGVLHRDIKPENVLIDSRGRVKIADFGIAKLIGDDDRNLVTLTMHGSALGSPHYMAPEQIETPADVDQRADIYSLGVVFYELLTGELPIGRFAPPSEKSPAGPRVDEVVMRTLEKEREARYQSIGEVQTQVDAITRSRAGAAQGLEGTQPPPAPQPAGPLSRPETARFATASAILTGTSLVLSLCAIVLLIGLFSLVEESTGPTQRWVGSMRMKVFAVGAILVTGLSVLWGFIFGVKALKEICESGGRKRGFTRAMFGTLTWPLLFLFILLAALIPMGLRMTGVGLDLSVSILIVAGITVAAAILLIRTVWRWVRGGAHGGPVATEKSRGPWVILAVVLVFLAVPVGILGIIFLLHFAAVPRPDPGYEDDFERSIERMEAIEAD